MRKVEQVCGKRDNIPAAIASREVGPAACAQIDLEGAKVSVLAARIERNPLLSLTSPIGQPPLKQLRQVLKCSSGNLLVVGR